MNRDDRQYYKGVMIATFMWLFFLILALLGDIVFDTHFATIAFFIVMFMVGVDCYYKRKTPNSESKAEVKHG